MVRLLAFVSLLLTTSACAQEAPAPPSATDGADSVPGWFRPPPVAARFAPELEAADGATLTPTFTPDLRTVVYARWDSLDYDDPTSIQRLFTARWDGAAGAWTEPEPMPQTAGWRVDFPHITPDGQRLLVSFNRPHPGQYGFVEGLRLDDFDLWEADRLPDGPDGDVRWSDVRPIAGDDLNRQKTPANARVRYVHNETSPRTDRAGRLYFWTERLDDGGGWRDAYVAEPDGEGGFRAPTLLPFNTPERESGIAVDPDGEWVVFASEGRGGEGRDDLFVVAREGDGWGEPVNLGPSVNSAASETSPEVSPDGRALFFTTDRRVDGVRDVDTGESVGPPSLVFWVDLEALAPFRRATGAE